MPDSSTGNGRGFERVLYVEDDLDIQTMVRFALEELAGLVVEVANSGEEALAKLANFLPDLILLDVMMPKMDGFATLAALRQMPEAAGIPVVFMTAAAEVMGERWPQAGRGILGVIKKPFDPLGLARHLREMWSQRG